MATAPAGLSLANATTKTPTPALQRSSSSSNDIPTIEQARSSTATIRKWYQYGRRIPKPKEAPAAYTKLLETSAARLAASPVTSDEARDIKNEPETFLYLAYGSNLAASTFRGTRGIRPLSAVNVLVPSLKLTFDLPGMPYKEPCFANTIWRNPDKPREDDTDWRNGLVGVVYEVTQKDYAHIIATEGGGAGYKDVIVPCYKLEKDSDDVPEHPDTKPFAAHTLLAPPSKRRHGFKGAEPSPRYKGLLTTGAMEHGLPTSWRRHLDEIPTYRITSLRQQMGQLILTALFLPLILALFALGRLVANKDGIYPKWLAEIQAMIFEFIWVVYKIMKPIFGNGERTEKKGSEEKAAIPSLVKSQKRKGSILRSHSPRDEEKARLLKEAQ